MNGYLLIARMEMDDLPLRWFANEVAMGHWLQFAPHSFEEEIDELVKRHGLSRSPLLRIEAWEYQLGELAGIKHVMGFGKAD